MKLLLLILLPIVAADYYKETQDFQYSRTGDEGEKQGFYGSQSGNMGGNYEVSHNMDNLATKQMKGLIDQVGSQLGIDPTLIGTGHLANSMGAEGSLYGSASASGKASGNTRLSSSGYEGAGHNRYSGSRTSGSGILGTQLSGSHLSGSHLTGTQLSGSRASGSGILGTQLSGSHLSGSRASESESYGAGQNEYSTAYRGSSSGSQAAAQTGSRDQFYRENQGNVRYQPSRTSATHLHGQVNGGSNNRYVDSSADIYGEADKQGESSSYRTNYQAQRSGQASGFRTTYANQHEADNTENLKASNVRVGVVRQSGNVRNTYDDFRPSHIQTGEVQVVPGQTTGLRTIYVDQHKAGENLRTTNIHTGVAGTAEETTGSRHIYTDQNKGDNSEYLRTLNSHGAAGGQTGTTKTIYLNQYNGENSESLRSLNTNIREPDNTNRLVIPGTGKTRLFIRPGQTVHIPFAVRGQENTHLAGHSQTAESASDTYRQNIQTGSEASRGANWESSSSRINTGSNLDVNDFNKGAQQIGSGGAKRYQSSYSYKKQWEKTGIPVNLDAQGINTDHIQNAEVAAQSRDNLYTGVVGTSGNRYGSTAFNRGDMSSSNLQIDRAQASAQRSDSHQNSNLYRTSEANRGDYAENEDSTVLNNVGGGYQAAGKPKSYQSSFSYHKSWEKHGTPYVIQEPQSGSSNHEESQNHELSRTVAGQQAAGYRSGSSSYGQSQRGESGYSQSGSLSTDLERMQQQLRNQMSQMCPDCSNAKTKGYSSSYSYSAQRGYGSGAQNHDSAIVDDNTNENNRYKRSVSEVQDLLNDGKPRGDLGQHFEQYNSQQSETLEQQLNSYDQQSGNFEQQLGNFEQQTGNFEQQTGNFEQQTGNFEQQTGNFEQQTGNFEQQTGNFEQQTGNFEQQTGNFEQTGKLQVGNFEQQTGELQIGNFEQQLGNFEQQTGNFEQQTGNFEQQTGNFEQQTGNFEQQTGKLHVGNFEQQTGNFEQQTGNFEQQTGNFEQQTGNFEQQIGNFEQQTGEFQFGNSEQQVGQIEQTEDIGQQSGYTGADHVRAQYNANEQNKNGPLNVNKIDNENEETHLQDLLSSLGFNSNIDDLNDQGKSQVSSFQTSNEKPKVTNRVTPKPQLDIRFNQNQRNELTGTASKDVTVLPELESDDLNQMSQNTYDLGKLSFDNSFSQQSEKDNYNSFSQQSEKDNYNSFSQQSEKDNYNSFSQQSEKDNYNNFGQTQQGSDWDQQGENLRQHRIQGQLVRSNSQNLQASHIEPNFQNEKVEQLNQISENNKIEPMATTTEETGFWSRTSSKVKSWFS